jgi:hypothetical protein
MNLLNKDRNWAFVDDHITITLVRQNFLLGHREEALQSMEKLLMAANTPHGSIAHTPQKQSSYVREFMQIVKEASIIIIILLSL